MRKTLKIIYWLVCIAVFCASAEWYVRHRGYVCEMPCKKHIAQNPNFSPLMGWEHAGPQQILSNEQPPNHKVYEHILPDKSRVSRRSDRPKTAVKILMLGCSFTYGVGVDDEDTYVWMLNDRFPNITFDNYAQDGYGTLQCLLREEKLLKETHYDYVIYAAILDHFRRNISFATWRIDEAKTNSSKRQVLLNMLKEYTAMWYYPLASVNPDGSLRVQPADYHWPGDEHSAFINTLKRLYMFRYFYKVTHNLKEYAPYSREIYWRILYRMNEIAREHGSRFATICLVNDTEKDMQPPTEKDLSAWNKGHSQKLSLPLPFPYYFATEGHGDEKDQPKFHVAGIMHWHGTRIVHRNWEKQITPWLIKWIQETNSDPSVAVINKKIPSDTDEDQKTKEKKDSSDIKRELIQ